MGVLAWGRAGPAGGEETEALHGRGSSQLSAGFGNLGSLGQKVHDYLHDYLGTVVSGYVLMYLSTYCGYM